MFCILVLLHPSPILNQNPSNSLDHIYHSVSPFSHPIPFSNGSVLHNDQACQKIWSTGSSVVAGGLVPRGVGNFSVVAVMCSVFECVRCSVEGAVDFAYHHPSPLLGFCIWGSLVPIHTSLFALESWWHGGLLLCGDVVQLLLWGWK